jgi:hypothetical protein
MNKFAAGEAQGSFLSKCKKYKIWICLPEAPLRVAQIA